MAKMIKRYWWVAALHVVLIASAALFLLHRTLQRPEPAAARPEPPSTQPTLDRLTYGRVQQLRAQLGLTNGDLAALGCSQANAEEVLGALLAWYQQNQSIWNEKESAVGSATNAVAETQRLIRVGPANPSLQTQLSSQRQTLATANAAWTQFVEGAVTAARSKLSSEQATLWTTARANLTAPGRYRYVSGISSANATRLRAFLQKRGQNSTDVSQVEQSLLSTNQRAAIAAALANAQSKGAGVQAAESSVLGRPASSDAP